MSSRKSLSLLLLALLGCCALFPGCSTPPKFSGVNVTLVGFKPVENASEVNRAIMTLRFTSEDVNADGFSNSIHQLYLGTTYVGKAENATPIGLPPQGTMTLDVTLVIENPTWVRKAIAISSDVKYRLDSELHYTDKDELVRLKAHDEGKVALSGLEQAVR